MKNKWTLLPIVLLLPVLFSMLFQSLHSYEHLIKEFSKKHCLHQHHAGTTDITHQHIDFADCFSCEFTFSSYIPSTFFSYTALNEPITKPYFYSLSCSPKTLFESTNSLRGPPTI